MILFDTAATMGLWRIDVDVAGVGYTIAARPAADWLLAILGGQWGDIVPGLLPADQASELDDLLADLAVDPAELRAGAQAALAAAAGTRWWTASLLAATATRTHLAGALLMHGLNPAAVSLGAYLSAAYAAAIEHMDKVQRGRFDMDLARPPADLPAEEWFDEEAAGQGWLDAMAAAGSR